MIGKTSTLFVATFVISITVFSAIDAYAFEPTKEENRIMIKYIIITNEIKEVCSDENDRHEGCEFLEMRQKVVLSQINIMGIFVDGQEPRLDHLTEEYTSTRQAYQAGIYPEKIDKGGTVETYSICKRCDDKEQEKTMYVKSGYKDPWSLFGIPLWEYYAGNDSPDINTGSISSEFSPQWRGLNQGIIPYCHTSSVLLPASASYEVGLSMSDFLGDTLVIPRLTPQESVFVWYDTNDKFEYPEQNNVVSGPEIVCTISGVSVN